MIKAVLFDFDETLQDRTLAFKKYMNTFFNDFFADLSEEEIIKRKNDMEVTGNGGYVNRKKWFNTLIDMWKWEDAPSTAVLINHYNEKLGLNNVVFKESEPLLKELKKRGYITGVITNGSSKLQHTKLEQSGLLPFCDILVVSGDLPFAKPNPEIFIYTAKQLGVKTCECVYVGDHPVNDIEGSISAGMKAIRMNWGWFLNKDLREDVPTISNIYDVLKYV